MTRLPPSGTPHERIPVRQAGGKRFRKSLCDAIMHHMKKTTVRDLRYRFREVESMLREGEEIHITKRKKVIARLLPCPPASDHRLPDFLARLKSIYKNGPLKVSGAKLIAQERGRY